MKTGARGGPEASSLVQAFETWWPRIDPAAPGSLRAAAQLLLHLNAQGHTALPLHDGGALARQALADARLTLPAMDALASWPRDTPAARQAWGASALIEIEPAGAGGASPLVWARGRLSLRRHWHEEQRAAARLLALAQDLPKPLGESAARAQALLDVLFPAAPSRPGPDLQRLAAERVLQGRLLLISGGPGTGKTWTAARVLVLLQALQRLHESTPQPLRLALTAPTGKAAARLRQSTLQALQSLPVAEAAAGVPGELARAGSALAAALAAQPARTLHATLGTRSGTRRFVHGADRPLPVDLLVVDEASMVHLELLVALLEALPPTARLILLGDPDQLAPVETGAVFAELCEAAQQGPLADCSVALQQGHRFDGPIAALARAVNAGEPAAVAAALAQAGDAEDGALRVLGPGADLAQRLLQLALSPQGFGRFIDLLRQRPASASGFDSWVLQVLAAFDHFRLLVATHEGPWGQQALNGALDGLFRAGGGHYEGRPVMVTRNEPALDLFNGDVGVLLSAPDGSLRLWRADSGALNSVAAARLPPLQSAWAMTVHKSQGSEFMHAAVVLPQEDQRVLSREALYTGITRARQALTLVLPAPELLLGALGRRTARLGGFAAAMASQGGSAEQQHPS
jgi:exodeoxyribonuclease V alpha subunit